MRLSYRWQVALVVALGLIMSSLDNTIVSVVLPQIAAAFHTDFQSVTWVGSAYFLAQAAVIPVVGYFSDRVGTKPIFVAALTLFTVGSALCALAPDQHYLIAFRVLQGIGGGALMPVGMAILFRLFAPAERAGAMVLLMVPILLAPAFGPVLGGYLATNFSWNTIFTINIPVGIITLALALLVLRGRTAERATAQDGAPASQRIDVLGLVLSMTGFTALVYGISQAGSLGWDSTTVIAALVIGGIVLALCAVVELLVKDPVIDLRLFKLYSFTIANVLLWATSAVLFGSIFLLPYFFEGVEHLSALTTGAILIPQGLAMAVGVAVCGRLYNVVGPRVLTVGGLVIVAVSLLGFTHLDVTTTGADLQWWLILRGLGMGAIFQPLQTLGVSAVNNQQMAKASSLISVLRMVTGALGIAGVTTYVTQQATSHGQAIAADLGHKPPTGIAATCLRAGSGLHTCVAQHAVTMGINDTFWISFVACLVCAVVALFIGCDPSLVAAKAARREGRPQHEAPRVPVAAE
jgi:EmrB/QacA subfamily drug resistance transporter